MAGLLLAVPNLSEGRDLEKLERLERSVGRARVLDVHTDPDHHRSVFTLVGDDEGLVRSLVAGIERAAELIDLRVHDGIHPRVGAADVVPIVPLAAGEMPRAVEVAREVGSRVGAELGLPVFLYGESGNGRRPVFFRHGGPEELQRRVDAGELQPDFGPDRLHPTAGAVLVGARSLLVAFNLELATDDLEQAREIAAAVRGSSGGMVGVQALGLLLPHAGVVQVSLNIVDVGQAALADVVARVRAEAALRGVEVRQGELVGLIPESAAAAPAVLALDALPGDRILERRVRELTG